MKHDGFEELQRKMAVFKEVAEELEALTYSLDDAGCSPGESFSFSLGEFEVGDFMENDDYEVVSFSLWLHLAYGDDELPGVLLSMAFCDCNDEGPVVHVQHQEDRWEIISEYDHGRIPSHDAHESSRHNDLLSLLDLRSIETKDVTEAQAFDAIRIMAEFFLKIEEANRAQTA